MSVCVFESAILGPLLSDEAVAACFSETAEVRALLRFEAALAEAEAQVGVIPAEAARRIAAAAAALDPDPAALGAGTAAAGVVVPALVAALRGALDAEIAQWVHWGASSQDVVDTGLVLRLREALAVLDRRLAALIGRLADLAEAHRATVMAARTRGQQATPTSFGLKAAGWLLPLVRHRARLAELRPRLLLLSFGGAAGTLAALGERGPAVEAALAETLGLGVAPLPWHAERDGLAELAGWLSLVSGGLGKIGTDVALLAQSEVAEVRPAAGGASSTMPQKANPVGAEVLVALARFNAGLLAGLHHGLLHAQERDGAGWTLEWMSLPQMLVATGAALRQAERLLDGLVVDAARMRANLDLSNGLILAEAASFALARHLPRPAAQALVKAACRETAASGRHLLDVLAERSDAPVDWQSLRDPAQHLGAADVLIDRALRAAGR